MQPSISHRFFQQLWYIFISASIIFILYVIDKHLMLSSKDRELFDFQQICTEFSILLFERFCRTV
jgi:hypothetical protein